MPNSKLKRAVQFAVAHETPWSREIDAKWGIHHEDPPPWNRLLGPVHARGSVSGTLIMGGKTLISWGEPNRPDLTFSIAKTYLALLAGVAYDRGLLPDVDEPVILPRTSEGLYLLQRLRDEAHRFAITHHRSRRSKSMVESLLDQVPGLGEVRRKALISYFGSLKKLRAATVEEIAAVPGFGPKTAAAIKLALQEAPRPEAIDMATGEVLDNA